jgi:protein O-GlcNAc transferase
MPQELFQEHLAWARHHASGFSPRNEHTEVRNPDRRSLRVGFVSPDFRDHPVARFLRPIVEHRNRAQFQFIAYSSVDRPDQVTAHLRVQFDEWYDVAPLDNAQLADVIRGQHKIDILIDLAGHTGGSRMSLFVRKPAPVQITYLGYPDTSGIPQMDFRITDAIADPVGVTDSLHTEKLLRLDGCFLAYTLLDDTAAASPLAPSRDGPIVFGSFNNLAKISPTTIRLWSGVLSVVPDARMLIKTTSLGDPPTLALTRDRFALLGLPMERVELLGPELTQTGHLAQYARIDVALDTFPYNGTTTTCEALSMGVPVVSLHGEHHASRVSLSILTAAGFPQWATDDSEKFVAIAKELAGQSRSLRPQMRDRLRASPLCDGQSLARRFESALRRAWQA